MNLYTFTPKFKNLGNIFFDNEFVITEEMIKNEPMFFSSDANYIYDKRRVITDFVLKCLENVMPKEWFSYRLVIDSRSHMLMPGFYPAIPGWHHDDVPRSRKDGQPNYENPEYKAQHLMVVIGNTAMTQFLRSTVVMPSIPEGKTIYQAWDRIINASVSEDDFFTVGNGDIYQFDYQTFHRATEAKLFGWRYFIRFSWNTERKILNEIRNQVQCYITDPSIGW